MDIVAELLRLTDLSPAQYRYRINKIARAAAAEIVRLRGESATGSPVIDWNRRLVILADGTSWRPQPQGWLILTRLLRSPGCMVSFGNLFEALYGDDADGGADSAMLVLRVVVSKLRRRSPWPIVNVYHDGYRIEGYRRPVPILATGGRS